MIVCSLPSPLKLIWSFHSGPNVYDSNLSFKLGKFSSHSGPFNPCSESLNAFTIQRRANTHILQSFEPVEYSSISSSYPPQLFLIPSIIEAFKSINFCFASKSADITSIMALVTVVTWSYTAFTLGIKKSTLSSNDCATPSTSISGHSYVVSSITILYAGNVNPDIANILPVAATNPSINTPSFDTFTTSLLTNPLFSTSSIPTVGSYTPGLISPISIVSAGNVSPKLNVPVSSSTGITNFIT